jgi:DNA-binding SARP family transcriptional activator
MRKEQALLAYLAVESARPHRREALAELFWPERPAGVARAGLRQALSDVRRAIGRECLQTTRLTVRFNTATEHWLDLDVYRAQLAAVRAHTHDDPEACPLCMGRLQQAVALYRGPFLAGLELDDSRAFQEWVTLHRERLFRQQGEALRRLTAYRLALGELERARRYARRWVELDP